MAWIATACQVFVRCPRFSVSGRCPPFGGSARYSRLCASSRQPKGWTPNARFLDSQNRGGPSFPVVQNGILAPRLFSKLPPHFGEVFLSAGERPVLPPLHIAVVNRIIVDVIHRRPEMRVVAHVTLRRAAPDLSASREFLAVPLERQPPVHPAKVRQHGQNLSGFDERMVMVRQDTPSMDQSLPLCQDSEQCVAECLHPFAVLPDVVPVLEASSGDVVAGLLADAMGRTMLGQTLAFAPGHQAFALPWRQLAPEIGWSAHTRSVF